MGFPCGLAGKESICIVGNLGSIPGLGRSHGKEKATHSSVMQSNLHSPHIPKFQEREKETRGFPNYTINKVFRNLELIEAQSTTNSLEDSKINVF